GSTVVLQGAGEKLCATAPGCQPRERPRVAGAAGDATPIGPLEQRNQILARDAEAVTQHRRRRGTKLGEGRRPSRAELLQRRLRCSEGLQRHPRIERMLLVVTPEYLREASHFGCERGAGGQRVAAR